MGRIHLNFDFAVYKVIRQIPSTINKNKYLISSKDLHLHLVIKRQKNSIIKFIVFSFTFIKFPKISIIVFYTTQSIVLFQA